MDEPILQSTDDREHPISGANAELAIDYDRFLDCVHCGLCTSACPTYLETGDENDSPRGRIYLMRAVTDERLPLTSTVRNHLDLCLDCRACETACPSGVQYGHLIERFRAGMTASDEGASLSELQRFLLLSIFPSRERTRWALLPARLASRLGLLTLVDRIGLLKILPGTMRQLAEMLPSRLDMSAPLPSFLPAIGTRRARVALFTGCVADAMLRHVHWATARVLQQNGCDVVVPRAQVCCGAIHYHAGDTAGARELADRNVEFLAEQEVDAIVVDVAGCGAMLKEYGDLWDDDGREARGCLAGKVKDVCEFLDELGLVAPEGSIRLRATYHDACHLGHAQGIRDAPRRILAQVPGIELVDLRETDICCGAAGTYNLTQPEMSNQLSERKMRCILETDADAVLTGNAGCILQIQREARRQRRRLWVAHPMEVLDLSYRGENVPAR